MKFLLRHTKPIKEQLDIKDLCQKLYAGIILVERTHRVNNDGKGILKIPSHAVRSLEREQRWQEGINNNLSRHTNTHRGITFG